MSQPSKQSSQSSQQPSQQAAPSPSTSQGVPPAPEPEPSAEPPEKKTDSVSESVYENEPDETLPERLWGLTEMFPEPVRNAMRQTACCSCIGVKRLYMFSRSALWIVFSTSLVLFAPAIFEVERAQLDENQRNQQKQILLGPNSAQSGPGPILPGLSR